MNAEAATLDDRLLDATLEAAWLDHPCSPLDAVAAAVQFVGTDAKETAPPVVDRGRAQRDLAQHDPAQHDPAQHDLAQHDLAQHDLVFAHLIAASSHVRVAAGERARPHLAMAREALSRSKLRDATFRRLLHIMHGVHAALHWVERDLVASMVSFERALAPPDVLLPSDEHYIRMWRAVTLLGLGKPELAFRDLLIGLEYFRLHHPPAHAVLAFNVGVTLLHAGDWEGAESCSRIAMAEKARVGMPGFEVMCRSNLAYCLINTGRIEEATIEMDIALGQNKQELLTFRPGDVMTTVAENLIETGHLAEAQDYVFDALDAAIGREYAMGVGTAKWNQGRIAVAQGKTSEAVTAWRVALWNLRRHPHLTQFWKTALGVSDLYAKQGDYRRAFRWHQRFHASHRRWQDTTRDVRLAYSQAMLQMEEIRRERDQAEAERFRLLLAKTELEAVNSELKHRFTEIEALHEELREQASRDPLTGLLNRRSLLPTLDQMIEKTSTSRQYLVVAMLDLDRFKQFNDKHGHVAGDQMLSAAGHLLREFFRDDDCAFRYGGDEFCIFLPRTNRAVGQARLDAFSQGLDALLPSAPDGTRSGIAVSFGIACFPDDSRQANELVALADAALYRAKRQRKEALGDAR